MTKVIYTFLKLKLLVLALLFSIDSSAQFSMGFVDFNEVLQQHPKSAEVFEELNNYRQSLVDRYQELEQEFVSIYTQYAELSEQEFRDTTELGRLRDELLSKEQEINEFADLAESSVQIRTADLLKPLHDDIDRATMEIGRLYNLNCIAAPFSDNGDSFVIHGPKEADLTNAYISALGGEVENSEFTLKPNTITIGYMNVEKVLAMHPKVRLIEGNIQYKVQELELEISKKEGYIKEVQDALNLLHSEDANNPSIEDYENALKELYAEVEELNTTGVQRIEEERNEQMISVLEELQNAIDQVAEKFGFTFIVNGTSTKGVSSVVYSPIEGDVSYEVMKILGIKGYGDTPPQVSAKKKIRVGFVNIESIMEQLDHVKLIDVQVDAYRVEIENEIKNANITDPELWEQTLRDAEYELILRKQELLTPIIKQLQEKVDSLAESGQYDYIFNITSTKNILYNSESDDLNSDLLKAMQ